LCKLVEQDDGLAVRESGEWAEKKLHFWARYIDITTRAMVGHPQWKNGLTYVDLFSGPGVCVIKETGTRFPGSPLIAASASKPFTRLILCDIDRTAADACTERINGIAPDQDFQFHCNDSNVAVDEIVKQIIPRSLTLAFIDPTGLHAHFETVRKLSQTGRVDLVVYVPDAVDIARNVDIYLPNPNSNLDRFLGPTSNWRDKWKALGDASGAKGRKLFSTIYQEQLKTHLGYEVFDDIVIQRKQAPLYRLIYASKHTLGLDFWKKATSKDVRGQRDLF
jgi:three-Cys-motif partner protein